MMTPGGRGALRTAATVLWRLRGDLVAVMLVAAAMGTVSAIVPLQGAAAVVPLLGVVVSIFIGFRNSSAFSRWWEARTLWSTLAGNCRATSNAFVAVEDGSADMAQALDRMRRRVVRHAWQLAAELRRLPAPAGVGELTPEDPADADAATLLRLQAADTRDLVNGDHLDRQGRSVLTNLNSTHAATASGLERIRNQPIPEYYALFVRSLAWLFGILVCTRVDADGHHSVAGLLTGAAVMALFVVAERMGALAEGALGDSPFALPMDDICAGIAAELLGADQPPTETDEGTVSMTKVRRDE